MSPPSFIPGPIPADVVTSGTPKISQVIGFTFTTSFGSVATLIGTIKTIAVPGLQVGDIVCVNCISSPVTGMILANARVSATDTLELYFTTAIVIGITLGSLTFKGFAAR